MQTESQYILSPITKQDLREVTEFCCKYYLTTEPTSVFLGITPPLFAEAYRSWLDICCSSGFSHFFKFKGEIVSIVLALDYNIYAQALKGFPLVEYIEGIIEEAYEPYDPKEPAKSVSIFIGCTHPDHIKKGLFFKLIQQVEKSGVQKGYIECLADCTNESSERVFLRAGYSLKNRVFYGEFQMKGMTPFKDFRAAQSLSVVTKYL